MNEQEILAAIKEVEQEQKEARQLVAIHKKAVTDAESRLIAANLSREKLVEQLRVHRVKFPAPEVTPRDREIEAFRQKLPQYMERLAELDRKKEQ